VSIPIVVRCECGSEARGNAGDEVTCPGCGRTYATAGVGSEQLRAAANAAVRHKIMTRLGIGVVGLGTILPFFWLGYAGFFGGFVVTAVGWFGMLVPRFKRRSLARITAGDTARIDAV
jgi:hypothetical protein